MTDTRAMTLRDLLHLVDRARRGTILPAELDDLHGGITAMAGRLAKAERAANLLADSHRRAEEAEATVARVRDAVMNQSYLVSLDESIQAALDGPALRPSPANPH